MKKYLSYIPAFIVGLVLAGATAVYAATPVTQVVNGGTGSTTLTGILKGNTKNPIGTVVIGSNLTFDGTTLSATGGGGTPGGSSGQLQYNGAGTFQGVSTTSVSCSGNTSCTSFTAIGPSPITISSSGGGTNFWTSSGGNIYNNTGAQVQSPSFAATSTTASSTINLALGIATSSPFQPLSVVGNSWLGGIYTHFGTSSDNLPGNTLAGDAAAGTELIGQDNTDAGISSVIENTTSGINSYSDLFLGNDNTTVGGIITNYGALSFNSHVHTNTDFGTAFAPADQLSLVNTAGQLTLGATAAASNINFVVGGNASTNEIGRFTSAGLGIGTSTPTANLAVNAAAQTQPYFAIGSSTNQVLSVAPAGSPTLSIGTTSTAHTLQVTGNGFFESSLSNALSVGSFGSAALAFNIDQSGGVGTGLNIITSTVAANGITLQALSTATNEGLNIKSKGTGTVTIGGGGANITLTNGAGGNLNIATAFGASHYVFAASSFTILGFQPASAVATRFAVTGGIDTTLTASTEANDAYFNFGQTRQHATGALATQRDFRITGTTHSAVGASVISNAAAFSVDAPDSAGTNATISTSSAIYVPGGAVSGTVSTTTEVNVIASTGGTNNFAITAQGRTVLSGLNTGAGAGSACLTANGEVLFDSGANCIVSGAQFKNNILSLASSTGISEILKLNAVSFFYNKDQGDGGKQQHVGLIAQQVATVDPRLVVYDTSGTPISLHFEEFTGLFVQAIQDIWERLDTQQSEIDQLKAQNAQMQKEIDALKK